MKNAKIIIGVFFLLVQLNGLPKDPAKKKATPTSEKEKSLSPEEIKKLKIANSTYNQSEQKSGTPYSGVPTSGVVKVKKDELVTPVVDASTPK